MRRILYNLILPVFLFWGTTVFGQIEIEDTVILDVSPPDSTITIRYQTDEELVDDIISYAKKFLGTPYVYGGSTPAGFDCSGYVKYVMGHFGVELSRTSAAMSEHGVEVPLSEVQPGDLLFFKGRSLSSPRVGHVGMVISVEDDIIQFIHAAGNRVKIDTFNDSRYYVPRFIKATRLKLKNTTTEE